MRGVRRIFVAAATGALLLVASASAAGPFPGTKSQRDRAAWHRILHWPASCERDWRSSGATFSGVSLFQTATPKWLVAVTCIQGAYQGTQVLYLVDRERHAVGPLSLHAYRDPGSGKPQLVRETKVLGTIDFRPGTSRLVVFDKFRGVGDCGIYSVFLLQRTRFIPYSVHAKLNCNGKGPFDPARWPTLPRPRP